MAIRVLVTRVHVDSNVAYRIISSKLIGIEIVAKEDKKRRYNFSICLCVWLSVWFFFCIKFSD